MKSIFISYSHKDESLREELDVHLAMLKRRGDIDVWHDRRIIPGADFGGEIDAALERAHVVLLLVSPDFLASDYCYDTEMARAIERHETGDARVLPIIIRPCDWHGAPFGRLLAMPVDGKPVTKWPSLDEAFLDVVKGIRRALQEVDASVIAQPRAVVTAPIDASAATVVDAPRSANLRIRQDFSDADKDNFAYEAFEYIARFFEASLEELAQRHADIEIRFRQIDGNSFTSAIYRRGEALSSCYIRHIRDRSSNGEITYLMSDAPDPNSYNESMSVAVGEQNMFLQPMGMAMGFGNDREAKLTFEGAAEYYWNMLIAPLQR